MRVIGRSLVVLAAAFLMVGVVGGQGGGKGKGGGFGGGFGKGGFGGGGGAQDAYTLLKLPQVKKELDVTDEQVAKIPDAFLKALSGVLNEKQVTRLRQIELQIHGTQAFLDASVQKDLHITAEQSTSIKTIIDDGQKEIAEVMQEAGGAGGFQGIQEKLTTLRKETNDKVQGVLTADQRKSYKQMLGEEFKLEMKGGFGGGGGKGKGKKAKDI